MVKEKNDKDARESFVAQVKLKKITLEFEILERFLLNTITLLDQDNTVPFITRYRKERTGGLNETQIRQVLSCLIFKSISCFFFFFQIEDFYSVYLALQKRKATVLGAIEKAGKLTEGLKKKIQEASKLKTVEGYKFFLILKSHSLSLSTDRRLLSHIASKLAKTTDFNIKNA